MAARCWRSRSSPRPPQEWVEFPLLLNPKATAGNATLRILARPGSQVELDQVSLMPDSYRANGGFRPDLTQAAAALHPAVIRWPGGRFIGDYRWKDGIGPQSKRTGKNGWDEWDPLSFGIDEFIAFTRKLGAEPVIVVWTGPRNKVDRAQLHSGRGGFRGVLQWSTRQPVGQGPRAERPSRTVSRPILGDR